jgi:hypothetical protein
MLTKIAASKMLNLLLTSQTESWAMVEAWDEMSNAVGDEKIR